MSQDIQAIAFDKDGVIFDSEAIYHQTLLQSFKYFNMPFDEAYANQFKGMAAPKTFEILRQSVQPYVDLDEFIDKWLTSKDAFYQDNGLPFIEGVQQVIKTLYSQGYPLALVTSDTHENLLIDFSITDPELLSCFSVVITLDDVNEAKPNPEPYTRAAALLGVEANRLVVLEDSNVGVIAASESGANVLLYRPEGQVEEEIKQRVMNVIKHPNQLLDYLS